MLSGCTPKTSTNEDSLESSEAPVTSEVINYPLVEFRATSPIDIPSNAKIKLAGSFNSWNPLDEGFALTKLKDRVYTYTHAFSEESVGTNISFKFVLVFDDHAPSEAWDNEEVTAEATPVSNRVINLVTGKSRMIIKLEDLKVWLESIQ